MVGVISEHNFKSYLPNPAEDGDPNIEKATPKIILKGSWIFQPKNECITGEHYEIVEKQALSCQGQLQEEI